MRTHQLPAGACLLIVSLILLTMAWSLDTAASYPAYPAARPDRPRGQAVKGNYDPYNIGRHESRKPKCVAAPPHNPDDSKHVNAHGTSISRCIKKSARSRPVGITRVVRKPDASDSAPTAADGEPYKRTMPLSPTLLPGYPEAPTGPIVPPATTAPFRFFSSSSFWNEPLPTDAPLDPSTSELMDSLDTEIAAEEAAKTGPWINSTANSVPIYTVAANEPTVQVHLDHAPEAGLSSAWRAVPLPAAAEPAAGNDGMLVVWQPSSDRMWEFWHLVHTGVGWSASWGGAMESVGTNTGVYNSQAWPDARPWWGASASSLALVGGLITLEDLQQDQINHALAISVPNVRAAAYASPAQRTDGASVASSALPEGAHLRLDPALNLATLHLPPLTLMLAEAAQRYGIFVRDWSPIVAFYGQDPMPTGRNPYAGPVGYFEAKYPTQLLASFPWNHLQLLKMELH